MENDLLEYYNSELIYLREVGAEFARRYPKVASRLGMQNIEVADPYIERLMEGFAFLTARIQLKMDAEFPKLSQRILEMIYPNYLSPTPSMAIAELFPDANKGDLSNHFTVPRGTQMNNQNLDNEDYNCTFTTAQDTKLRPLKIKAVELGGIPPELSLQSLGINPQGIASSLKISLQTYNNIPLQSISLGNIMFHLCGSDIQANALLELIMSHTVSIVCQVAADPSYKQVLPVSNLRHEGFSPDQSLLPNELNSFDGYRLLQEYFSFPSRFLFFSIDNIDLFDQHKGEAEPEEDRTKPIIDQFDIFLLFNQQANELERIIDASHIALHCTPVINLFPKFIERITLNDSLNEYHMVVDNTRPLDYEIFSIRRLYGGSNDQRIEQEFRQFYQTHSADRNDYGAYYATRREMRMISEEASRNGSRSGYLGSELFFSLVDQYEAPYDHTLKYITADALCTNRDLPLLLHKEEVNFSMPDSIPVVKIKLKGNPSPPKAPIAKGMFAWKLVSHLSLNYLGLMDSDPQKGAAALRELLELYADLSEPATAKQIQGIRSCKMTPVYRKIPEPGPLVFGRGISFVLTVDESAFSGISPYVFGSVIAHLLSRHVSINTFTEMRLKTLQRGEIAYWPPRMGKRSLI